MTLPPNDLPVSAAAAYDHLSDEQQAAFSDYYTVRKRNTGLMMILAILFPIQLFLLGKIWLGILFWLTGGGFGVWYVIEWFLTPSRVRTYNAGVAADGMKLIDTGGLPKKATAAAVEEEE